MSGAVWRHTVLWMPAIEVEDLFKSYGPVDAVRGITFRVEVGEVFALLGPNGAGKTTTLEILEGHRVRSGGQVSVLGVDPQVGRRAFRERIGVVLQSAGIDGELTVREVLALYAGCYLQPLAVIDVIDVVGLGEKRSARVKTLSGGQRQRLDLALALVGDPDLIVLDEPTTGFDRAARRAAWRLVESLRGLGRTIVLTSHYMDEVQHLADRAVVLAGGRIVAEGEPDSLGGAARGETLISFRVPDPAAVEELPLDVRRLLARSDHAMTLQTVAPTAVLLRLCGWAVERDLELQGLEVTHRSLEEVYLELTEEQDDGGD